jgi:hypothetical protein
MKAIGCGEQPLPRIVLWQERRLERQRAKTDDIWFLLLTPQYRFILLTLSSQPLA